jgi:hypothetical protein
MVNFLGPGAFGCARPAAARPTFIADNAPGDVDDWAKDCTDPLARDGTEWRAPFLNFLIANFRELVAASGVPADNRDDAIFARAIQAGGMNYAVATGTANNWAVNPSLALKAYRAGLVLWLKAPATNTATEVSATLGVPGAVRIKRRDGTDPRTGDLIAGCWYPTFFDGTSLIIVATLPSETQATVSATVPISGNWTWSLNLANGANTTLTTAYAADGTLNLGDATFSAGVFTVGAQTAGLFLISFFGVAGSATTDLFLSVLFNGGSSIGAATSQTAQSATATTAITFKRMVAGDNVRFSCRQTVGSSQVINGRLNIIRLGA